MASITRYNPLHQAISLREAMDKLFEDSFISPFQSNAWSGRGVAANLYETTDEFVLQIPAPGVKPNDVGITVQRDVVSLKWEAKTQIPEGATVHFSGFQGGEYQQSFTLPSPINAERVEASYTDGILTLHLPKAEDAKARSIKVKQL